MLPCEIASPAPATVLADTIGLWRVPGGAAESVLLTRLPEPRWFFTGRYPLPVPFSVYGLRGAAGRRLATACGTTTFRVIVVTTSLWPSFLKTTV